MEMNAHGTSPRPKVGIAALIQNEQGQILLGLRSGAHGAGEWAPPGGSVEFGETLFAAAKREVQEETGLVVNTFELVSVADELRYIATDNKHYISIGIKAKYQGGEPKVMEPEKCKEWRWFALDALPTPMLEAAEVHFRNLRARKVYEPNP